MFVYCGNNPINFSDPTGTFFLYDWWNGAEDAIWKLGAQALKSMGYDLTAELLKLCAGGPGNQYIAEKNSAVAQEIGADEGFVNDVRTAYATDKMCSNDHSYTFDVTNGDLGAALHKVHYTYTEFIDTQTGKQSLLVVVTDTFDFTEIKNPFTQGDIKAGFLWLANDIACIDMSWGLLDPVSVRIDVVIPLEP